ncbi:MAG: hypothetical protein IJM90_08700, partial [Firmicutes bacterium]|nr:hypothetical protein [Bacillota bacterium]
VVFVKIKNLQQADFSIEEIKSLLEVDDEQLMEAFDQKIREQKQKLMRIQEIQRSYRKEKMGVQKTVQMIANLLEGRLNDPKLWQEFGLDAGRQTEINAQVHEMVADWLAQCKNASEEIAQSVDPGELETMQKVMDYLADDAPDKKEGFIFSVTGEETEPIEEIPTDAEIVFERSGWTRISDWIDEIPDLGDGRKSYFSFQVNEGSPVTDPAFPTLMLAVMATRYHAMNGGMYCNTNRSDDGQNHFTLYFK